MNTIALARALWIVPLLALIVMSCGDDKSTDPVDATPPQVVSHQPEADEAAVPVSQSIRIVFSEAMDPSSADGRIDLSTGSIASLDWEDSRTLAIEHTDWDEGVQITVTVSAGLTDVAGNSMGDPYIFSFWTVSTALRLLSSDPPTGATDVPRNVIVELLFSNAMNLQSLADATTVRQVGEQSTYTIELDEGDRHGAVLLSTNATLPATTAIEITITTDAQDVEGNRLAVETTVLFTTGSMADMIPPEIVAFDPPNGSTAEPDIGFLRITFSEPMNSNSIQPSGMNAEFWMHLLEEFVEPTWSQDNTVLTIALPNPLPAGLPMEVAFVDFQDRNGVVQTEEYRWAGSISGTADYIPVVDGLRFTNWHLFDEGPIGSEEPSDSFEGFDYTQLDVQTDGTFYFSDYHDPEFTFTDEWEVFRKTAERLEWIGSHDEDEGEVFDITFSGGLPYLVFPIVTGTYPATATVDVPGEGILDATWTLTIIGQEDVPTYGAVEEGGGANILFWKDCWKIQTVMDVTFEGAPYFERTQTLWFAPTIGLVQETSEEVDYNEGIWGEGVFYGLVQRLP